MLEGRRRDLDEQSWHGPTLVIAAQAFLLQILTSPSVHATTALVVAIAGTLASCAAIWSLIQQHDRERTHSEVVADEAKERLKIGDPRRKALEQQAPKARWWQVVARVPVRAWMLWLLTLGALVAADWYAYGLTERGPPL